MAGQASGQCSAQWAPGAPVSGAAGTVEDMVVFDADSGPALYVCDTIFGIADAPVNHVAKWDGVRWQAVANPGGGRLHAMAEHAGELYVAGRLRATDGSEYFGVARWDGADWQGVGGVFDGEIYDLASYQSKLIACGFFVSVDGVPAFFVAA